MTGNMRKSIKFMVLLLALAVLVSAVAYANPFMGKGKKATRKFELKPGLYLFKVEHKGYSNFDFAFKEGDGKLIRTLAKGTGPYDGTVVVGIPTPPKSEKGKKTYFVDVNADGEWTVTITSTKKEAELRKFEGETVTTEVSSLFTMKKGKYNFKIKHMGGREFNATLFDSHGQKIADLAKGVGQITENKVVVVPKDGDYIMEIKASGKYTVDVTMSLE